MSSVGRDIGSGSLRDGRRNGKQVWPLKNNLELLRQIKYLIHPMTWQSCSRIYMFYGNSVRKKEHGLGI